jgi:aminobenzoyl-glutamate utilization protein B
MNLAARVLAASAWDLFSDPAQLTTARAEHEQRLSGRPYKSLMREGQQPPLDYRNPPRP